MNLVLNDIEELYRLRRSWVIIYACSVEVEHLPVENLLAGAEVADALKQLLPVVTAACFLQQVVIHRKALFEIFLQDAQRPPAELRAA